MYSFAKYPFFVVVLLDFDVVPSVTPVDETDPSDLTVFNFGKLDYFFPLAGFALAAATESAIR